MKRYTYLIIGGGLAGDGATKGIRELDTQGSIGLIDAAWEAGMMPASAPAPTMTAGF